MDAVSKERTTQRRSLRIVLRVPLYVSPADAPPTAEWEPVETVVVSLHGGLIRSRQRFPVGTTLEIRMKNTPRSTRGRVVWTGPEANGVSAEVAFELMEAPGFWEIKFPADRWTDNARKRPR
jgi:hypothetical protein